MRHDIQILKVIRRDGTIQFSGGSKVVITGSYLEVVYPDFATWEEAARGLDLQVPGRRSYVGRAADPPGPPDRSSGSASSLAPVRIP